MANLQWKNNPIEKLESIANPDDEPSFADFESWKDNTFRSTISVGIPYIKKMIYDLEWNGGDPPILVPNAAAPEDYLGTEFQQSVIRMAVNAGREFSMPEPTGDLFRAINYKNIIAEVNSFGQQVARAGRKWHSEIFTQAEFADWPLKPLLEWKTMEVEYNPTRRSADTATYWKELNAALAPTEVSLEPDAMKQWIKAISLPRNELIRLQPATTVDSAIIGRVLDPIINADDKQPNHKQWSIQAVKWEETYSSNPSAMPWPTLKALLLKFVSKFAKDTKSANSSSAKRPRVSPAAPTGMALTAQHDETFQVALEAAYAAIHQGAGSAQEQRNQYPISPHPNPSIVCDNCGGRGHIQMFCPSPKFTRQQTMPPQQRISRWERGRGRGGTRGGMTRGGSGPPFHRDSGHQGSSGASRGQSSGSRGHSRGTPFHGLRGGSQTRTAPQTEPFLDVVDANAAAGLIAYDPDDEGEEWQENDQHHEDTQESSLFAFPPGQFGRAAERGQDFRTQFISGQDFGHHDAKSPPISAPDWADLESQPALDAPPPIPPTRPRLAARAREVAASMCSLIWFLPLLRTVATTIAATTPPAPRTPTAILSVILLLSTTLVLFPSIATFAFKSDLTRDTAFVSGFTANSTTTYLVDSGCTTSIICDPRFLRNYERMNTVSVAGLAGNKEYKWKAELHLPTLTDQGESITLIIPGCYWDPDGYYNLLATDQLHDAGYSILLDENRQHSMLTSKKLLTNIPMSRVGRLHDLPVHEHALPETTAFLGSNSNLSLEELFHMRMAHTPVPKLAQMSRQVEGVPRHLQCARALRFPCATCQHAKAIRQNYPDASTRVSNSNDALISWDLIDQEKTSQQSEGTGTSLSSSSNAAASPSPSSTRTGDTACHPGGGPTCNSGGGSISNHRGGPTEHAASNHGGGQSSQQPSVKVAPAGELRPVKRPTFNEAPLTYGTPHRKWWHCENAAIDDTSDEHLAEFLIGHSIDISFPAEYWPGDNGTWHGQAYDTGYDHKHFQQQLCLKTLIHNSSVKRKTGTWTYVPVSKPPGVITDVSARRALKLQFPKATLCKHLTGPHPKTVEKQPKRVTRSETRETARKSQLAATDLDKADKKLPLKSRVSQAALLTFATLSMLHSMQHEHGFISQFQPLEPKSQKEARASPQCLEWRKAEHVELKTVWDMGTFRIVDRQSHVIPLPSRFTYHLKRNRDGTISKYKARIVARGDMQTEDEYSTTYAPTSRFTAIRTIISIAAQEQMLLKHWDITGAFMTADIDTKIYMELPPGYSLPDGKCIELAKSLYGLRQSPGLFHDTLETWLLDYGFEPVGADRVIFKLARGTEKILLSLYVDDGLCATNSQALYDTFLADLSRKFALSDQGELSWYLGVGIDHNLSTGVTTLSQEQFVETIIERFSMQGCKPVSTPAEPHSHLLVSDCPATPDKDAVRKYQQIVGSLMYLSCFTRPDISYAVNQCAKFMSNPGPAHMLAAKRIIKYLAGTKDKRITYTRTNNAAEANVFTCYADADHAGDPDSRRSVTGYVTTLNGGAVSWQSVRQQVTALSSAEAEFYAASVAGTDVQYVRRLAEELGYPQLLPTPVFEDNMACIFMSESAAMYHKARHIDTRVYHLRELVKDGVVKLFKIPTESQVADSLTKATPRPAFMEHVRGMMGG
eukprot:CAMPEP_0181300748 /NCGR_PEP_ID=MMETSP1101-20121128/7054_1 /TAXON_ID=46948 /ORGANISM="Rhodomonas abbreviata, Strain Caron Lab Isolate" /LENGTH=1661 /DNA_ID=CAMNT_0023406003 /DNA_START=190 /DNA_END=5176 /DNA_ORIENTATION=-